MVWILTIFSILYSIFLAQSYIIINIPIEYEWSLNRSIWPVINTLTGTTALGQSGPGSNGHEEATPYSQEFQNLATRCLVAYTGHPFERVLPICRLCHQSILKKLQIISIKESIIIDTLLVVIWNYLQEVKGSYAPAMIWQKFKKSQCQTVKQWMKIENHFLGMKNWTK